MCHYVRQTRRSFTDRSIELESGTIETVEALGSDNMDDIIVEDCVETGTVAGGCCIVLRYLTFHLMQPKFEKEH